ncbi:hypothetical protein N0V90_001605 [Kalmusia sp. IMI 367209]|nr:hypothetical protein N0V90_001605 [Kalmusia sp. IMI 367209]
MSFVDEKLEKSDVDMKVQPSVNTCTGEVIEYSAEEEARIRRKIDMRLLPALTVLYLMSYLDRSNMGNAAIIGLKKDLNLNPTQYNLCLTLFFIPYSLFEVPSNLMLKVLRPSIWIAIMMLAWGMVATLMGIVQNFSGLMAARFMLAVGEAGFFPAAAYLLTIWYKRHEIQLRMAVFYSVGAFSGAVSGLLAYLINKMDGVGGLEGWRWVFILEGLLTVLLGVLSPLYLPDSPEACKFLSEEEKKIVAHRLQMDTGTVNGSSKPDESFKWKYVLSAFKDWKVWTVVVIYWGSAIPVYGADRSDFVGNNLSGQWKRASGTALMISVGNLGGVAGTNIYLAREAPYYWTGYGVSLGVIFCSTLAAVFLRWKLKAINRARDEMNLDDIYDKYTEEELWYMGDESPLFRYTT